MKTFVTIFFSLFLLQPVFGQSIKKLDERNGFKDFKLGDSFSKWQKDLDLDGELEDGTKAYLYKGACCQKVFNYPVDKIILRFSDEELVGIYITTEKFQTGDWKTGESVEWRTEDFESVNSSLSYLFGKQTSIEASDDNGKVTYVWEGKKVMLYSIYEFLGTYVGDRVKIILADKSFLKEGIEDGF